MHRPWEEEKVPKQTKKLSIASALLCFIRTQAWRTLIIPFVGTMGLTLGTGMGDCLVALCNESCQIWWLAFVLFF